jgi:transcriptional regulator with XRE-family HTH domain
VVAAPTGSLAAASTWGVFAVCRGYAAPRGRNINTVETGQTRDVRHNGSVTTAETVGERVASLRKLRGITGRELARRAYVSYSLVSKVETGRVPASPAFMAAAARALRVDVTQLTGQPYRGTTPSTDRIHEAVPQVRRELVAYGLPPADDDPSPRSLDWLRRAVAEVSALRHSSDLLHLGRALPGILAELRATAIASEGRERERINSLLAETYAAAGQLVWNLGYSDLWSITVDRYEWAAARSGDPLAVCVGDYLRCGDLLITGDLAAAGRALAPAFARLEADLALADAPTLSIWGSLHLKAALVAARAGDAATTWQHHAEAQTAAARIGADRDDYRLCFGPTNVGIWSVGLAVELYDGATAISHAQHVQIPRTAQRERVGHHHIDLARGRLWHGDRRGALEDLLTARSIAPQQTRYHPMVRETLHALARAERRATGSLRELAAWVGIENR